MLVELLKDPIIVMAIFTIVLLSVSGIVIFLFGTIYSDVLEFEDEFYESTELPDKEI